MLKLLLQVLFMIFLYPNQRDHQPDLLVEDHVNSMGFDVNGVLSHKLQDIFNSCCVWEAAEANAVTSGAGCWKEGRRRENWD